MASSDSELAAKKLAPKWVVGPKEDVVQVLMETLVDPLLPMRVSNVPPSEDSQKSVAKQMHTVVLLYNYYHRKQEPEQLFLDFVSFCKLAVAIRPPLTAFMKLMVENESVELNWAKNQLSLTEKAIKGACNIAAALDASKDVPNIEQWPVSKVVVLLIDSKKENCMLHFGTITQGVWSPIERELTDHGINLEISAEEKLGDKRKRNNQNLSTYDHNTFLQLGYDAVKDIAGIDSSELEVLETHVTYSLSKEKSAARFYMMQFSGSFSVKNQVPVKFLVESLQGPLAERLEYGFWRTTAVVEHYHMLPYVEIISSWLLRKDLCLPSGCNAQSTTNNSGKELIQSTTPASPVSECDGNDLDGIDKNTSGMKVNSPDKIVKENCDGNNKKSKISLGDKSASPFDIFRRKMANGGKNSSSRTLENIASGSKRHEKSSSGPSRSSSRRTLDDGNVAGQSNKQCDVNDSSMKEVSRSNLETSNTENDGQLKSSLSGSSRGCFSGKATIGDNVIKKSNIKHDFADSAKRDEYHEDEDASQNLCIRAYYQRRTHNYTIQNDGDIREDAVDLKADTVDILKSNCTKCKDEKAPGDEGDLTISCYQKGISEKGNQLVQFNDETKYNVEVSASGELQNALALLYGKRQELYSRICNMEDTLALYEDNITRIRDGGDVGLARQCIESIISGNYNLLLDHGTQIQDKGHRRGEDSCKSQNQKQTRLSERIYLPGKSSCQDLEYTCLKNNWRLPRYFLKPTDGKFVSDVIIEGRDFKLSSKGGLESRPCEARESAAAQMITKIQSIVYDRAD
ncbi:hypothetical protein CDL12_13486 [Handroanthus impetiginosus]|uniref:DRBM domain-containing protein n=1 Tax=Handroanthus impetiginosus TaxID=429701 RepID=A0A2G9H8N0_9LAMI|nr:hypothetical protein CDL12_13486 [Handroanthus impetiginosus]